MLRLRLIVLALAAASLLAFYARALVAYLRQAELNSTAQTEDELRNLQAELERAEALLAQVRAAYDRLVCAEAQIVAAVRRAECAPREMPTPSKPIVGRSCVAPCLERDTRSPDTSLSSNSTVPALPDASAMVWDNVSDRLQGRRLTEWQGHWQRIAEQRKRLHAEYTELANRLHQIRTTWRLVRVMPTHLISASAFDTLQEVTELRRTVRAIESDLAALQVRLQGGISLSLITLQEAGFRQR